MGLVVDCPAVGIRKTTYKYTRSTYDYRSGDTFYGAIVSVFGADGAILFQGATTPTLDPYAAKAP